MTSFTLHKQVTGWGRYPRALCHLYRPERVGEVVGTLQHAEPNGFLPRGLGRAYGDAALNSEGGIILMERIDRFLAFDESTGVVRCEAGVSLADIISTFLPRGWFLPVTPGTKFCTVGACVACDVHGKNHHHDGSIGNFVRSLTLLLPSGERVRCSREQNPELFFATIGGMGLTGITLEVELQLRQVDTGWMVVDYVRTRDLDETLRTFHERDEHYLYSVAWLDCVAQGRGFGRGVLMFGKHAKVDDLPPTRRQNPFTIPHKRDKSVPIDLPEFVLNPLSLKAFNGAYYAIHPGREGVVVDYNTYFYPLDSILQWNRAYGRRGFVQWQCVLPYENGVQNLERILRIAQQSKQYPFLSVLKRMGESSGGFLSFPMPGYTIALDFPMRNGLLEVLDKLDQIVVEAGGRLYLAKDARMSAETFHATYPQLPRWQAVKAQVDPQGVLQSDLARRLRLMEVAK
ncbi:MAG: oxidoreductase [Armatimonadota bacterium]|nr:MAG: oxidoreductase [Armatimonadota bacterium]